MTVLTTTMLAFIGTISRALAVVHEDYGEAIANRWNMYMYVGRDM